MVRVMLRAKLLRQAAGFAGTNRQLWETITPSVSMSEVNQVMAAVRNMRLTSEEASNNDLLWHLCTGYGYQVDLPPVPENLVDWRNVAAVFFREWPTNTARMHTQRVIRLFARFGITKGMGWICKLEQERVLVLECVADLNQVGPNTRLLENYGCVLSNGGSCE